MIIYNVTINIDNEVSHRWVKWMKEVHIPEVMATGCFTEYRMCRILVDDEQGISYCVMYTSPDMATYTTYKNDHAPVLQKKTNELFEGRFVAFRTLLEIL